MLSHLSSHGVSTVLLCSTDVISGHDVVKWDRLSPSFIHEFYHKDGCCTLAFLIRLIGLLDNIFTKKNRVYMFLLLQQHDHFILQ